MEKIPGHILQILGGVVDVEFDESNLPELYEALDIPVKEKEAIVLEVEKHIGNGAVRCVAMDSTDGLRRGMEVWRSGLPISVPVGPNTLGRIFNEIGRAHV